jgi:hypothetical protein
LLKERQQVPRFTGHLLTPVIVQLCDDFHLAGDALLDLGSRQELCVAVRHYRT